MLEKNLINVDDVEVKGLPTSHHNEILLRNYEIRYEILLKDVSLIYAENCMKYFVYTYRIHLGKLSTQRISCSMLKAITCNSQLVL